MAILAHELRAPLNAIRGWVQMALGRALPPERLEYTLQRVIGSTDRMVRLVEDMSEASRIINGALPLQFAPVDLAAIVRHAAAELGATAEEKQLTMRVHVDDHPIVYGDRLRLAQIAGNLLSNAVKYTSSGGRVTAIVGGEDACATVEIRDTGRGIAPEELPHVFDRFRRARDAERGEPGLGLGLWITRELVEAHRGSVTVTSEGTGRGATVRLRLPLATDRDAGDEVRRGRDGRQPR
jgi:signal transduction histidine kinase